MAYYDALAHGHLLNQASLIALVAAVDTAPGIRCRLLAPAFVTGETLAPSALPLVVSLPTAAVVEGTTAWSAASLDFTAPAAACASTVTMALTPATTNTFTIAFGAEVGGSSWAMVSDPKPPSIASLTRHTTALLKGQPPRAVKAYEVGGATTADEWTISTHPTLGAPFVQVLCESASSSGSGAVLTRASLDHATTALTITNLEDVTDARLSAFWLTPVCATDSTCTTAPAFPATAAPCTKVVLPNRVAPPAAGGFLRNTSGHTAKDFTILFVGLGLYFGLFAAFVVYARSLARLHTRTIKTAQNAADAQAASNRAFKALTGIDAAAINGAAVTSAAQERAARRQAAAAPVRPFPPAGPSLPQAAGGQRR